MASVVNGWTLYTHPIFGRRLDLLRDVVRRLRKELSPDAYAQHPTVKLLAGVRRLMGETIPANPDAPEFRLRGDLAAFRRAKGHSLPPRYRLFFAFSSTAKAIIFLYLNDDTTLRQEGSKTDPYVIFARLVARGEIGADFKANMAMLEPEEKEKRPRRG